MFRPTVKELQEKFLKFTMLNGLILKAKSFNKALNKTESNYFQKQKV